MNSATIYKDNKQSVKAEDLGGEDRAVVISGVDLKEFEGGQSKLVLSFQGKSKTLVLNKTNARKIEAILGTTDTDRWIGQTIVLYPTETDFQGQIVSCIRIKAPKAEQPSGAPRTIQERAAALAKPAPHPPPGFSEGGRPAPRETSRLPENSEWGSVAGMAQDAGNKMLDDDQIPF